MKKRVFLSFVLFWVWVLSLAACASADPLDPQYTSPLAGAGYVSPGATIIVRYGPVLNERVLSEANFQVQGSKSGTHQGQTILADDDRTIIFKPDQPFTPGEQVQVDLEALRLDSRTRTNPLSYTFTVAENQRPGHAGGETEPATEAPASAFPDFLTLPQDIPHYTVAKTSPDAAEGYIFVAPFYWTKSTLGSYLLILNNQGQIVYYQSVADEGNAFDFKVQPNGLLSYFGQNSSTFYLMDSHYQVVDTYQAGNGYTADLHDLQLLPNGNALLMAYDLQTVDMSRVVPDGKGDANVTGLILQELDPSKNVIFEWRSWDHIPFTDSNADLTEEDVDYVHGNALEVADDGNLLLSSRHLSEITKIDRQTGEVIWRMGGKANQFTFEGGEPYAYQHDIRQLPNGNLTVFDNQGYTNHPAASKGIEYRIDEETKTATQVWQFEHQPPVFATFMGNTQRLPNGNTFLDWGAPYTKEDYAFINMSEVTPDNDIVFQLSFDRPYVSYRAFRFPWQSSPDAPPDLAARVDESGITLGYSWNGATGVASYRLLGGYSPQSLQTIEEKPKADFETQSHWSSRPDGECYYQVAALDEDGGEMARSKVISTDPERCPSQ